MNIKELAEGTSGPVRAALLALEAKVMMLEHDLAESVEQHEEFKQEVSDAVEQADLLDIYGKAGAYLILQRFIIPAPKPDPLVEVLNEISHEGGYDSFDHYAHRLRAALEARGLEIRSKNDD